MSDIHSILCQEIKVMSTTEMVQLAKEFVTKLDNKLDLKDPHDERWVTLFPQAVLWHSWMCCGLSTQKEQKKVRDEEKARESKGKRKKAENMKTDITKARMNGLW